VRWHAAREKAEEIRVKTEAEFNIEKLNLIEKQKIKIRDEFDKKSKQIAVKRRM